MNLCNHHFCNVLTESHQQNMGEERLCRGNWSWSLVEFSSSIEITGPSVGSWF